MRNYFTLRIASVKLLHYFSKEGSWRYAMRPPIEQFEYARGEHPPPHFHLVGPGWEAVIDIATMRVTRGEAPGSDLAEAIEWAKANTRVLLNKWSELNERDD
jgi:hypothetical protein